MFHALAALLVVASACAGGGREPSPSNHAAATASGALAGHRFTLAIGGGTLVERAAAGVTWRLGDAEVHVQDLGPVDDSSRFLVERSPRTIVRSEGPFTIVTEVVVIAGARVFGCTHQVRVPDPDAPEAKALVERAVAVCSSLRVEP